MLTYDFSDLKKEPLYDYLYRRIRADILSGRLRPGERMPSKRAFAANLGISVITVETAYAQLTAEGYLSPRPRSGYYVEKIQESLLIPEAENGAGDVAQGHMAQGHMAQGYVAQGHGAQEPSAERAGALNLAQEPVAACGVSGNQAQMRKDAGQKDVPGESRTEEPAREEKHLFIDLAQAGADPEMFPYPVWSRLMRETLRTRQRELLERSPGQGLEELREAIARYLLQYRSLRVSPEQIIIGAGTEYLYGLLIRLLGTEKAYAVESPGYPKTGRIYESSRVTVCPIPMDPAGIDVGQLRKSGADVVHISPSHQFPTGITMPVSRRSELLSWSAERSGERYIIEDDYDSEFRLSGRPIPALMSMDRSGTAIYLNTFTKSVAPTLRIAYMVLPEALLRLYRKKLGFFSCTVPNFEQYVLAQFLARGYFEKHINRMRKQYRQKRDLLLGEIGRSPLGQSVRVEGADAGLHFLMHVKTACSEAELSALAEEAGVKIYGLSTYAAAPRSGVSVRDAGMPAADPCMVVSYSGLTQEQILSLPGRLQEAWRPLLPPS